MLKLNFIIKILLLGSSPLFLGNLPGQAADSTSYRIQPDEVVPVDPDVIKGKLENGLTYYIRENSEPENRAQVWLAVNAGSIMEDEDQLGLAHVLEHMAFNGTESFAKQEIIDYLELIGMKVGPEINAYTGFDETVYTLQLPTDNTELLKIGFQILEEWANRIRFEPEEIEKERGVVIEEWRQGRGAEMRMLDQQLPILFKGSRYAERLPIGNKKTLETFQHEKLIDFYRDWYRPDLMAVIAVGDFDPERIEEMIQEQFSNIPVKENPRERVIYPVPDHKETLFSIAKDKESTVVTVSVLYKNDILSQNTVEDYHRIFKEQLFTRMLNLRLYELLSQAEPPYLNAHITNNDLVRSKAIYSLDITVRDNDIKSGLEAILAETNRVKKHGFTQSELERTKTWIIRNKEQEYQNRNNTVSSIIARKYLNNFLKSKPIPDVSFEYQIVKRLVPGITLDEVNQMAGKWLADENRVVLVNAPQKRGLKIPDESSLLSSFATVAQQDIPPYEDYYQAEPLMEELETHGDIISEDFIDELDVTSLKLSNGINVLLKPTTYKNDEILFKGISPGGNSVVEDKHYRSICAAPDLIQLSGAGNFDLNNLNKKLSGKRVTVFPCIEELYEGISGQASLRDMETMFQLVYLYMARPRFDSSTYLSYKNRLQGFVENRVNNPIEAYYDTLQVTLANYHFRERPWSMELFDEIDPVDSYNLYLDRFSDAGDFTFIFVGNFDVDSIRPLVRTYLGSLPSTGRDENWKDTGMNPPKGVNQKTVYGGTEPKSLVSLTFTGKVNWNEKNNYALTSMASILRIKLRETLREELSGTYGTSVTASTSLYPKEQYKISIQFNCAPERAEELTTKVFEVIDQMKAKAVKEKYIVKIRESQRRSFETNLKQDRFWLFSLVNYVYWDKDPRLIMNYPELVSSLDTKIVQKAAKDYFNMNNYVHLVLNPENN
jgi:zinc protease